MADSTTKRLPLSTPAKNLLWSESGGHCQNPQCRADLHVLIEQQRLHLGELAHIIPASSIGPRADEDPALTEPDRAQPENILLLCPTCHKMIDKAPDAYPATLLREWKQRSQKARAEAFGTPVFDTRAEARVHVEPLLEANRAIFDRYGPRTGVFDDDRADQWQRHVATTIIPNNQQLQRVLHANRQLLTAQEKATFHTWAIHAQEFEERHLDGNWTAGSTRFPLEMATILEDEQ
ncbi:HNH endonuclease [Amycolatopsis sp. cmx-4-83]|uniref:HNH endonuclease n=1 Tax=Amycolatopsis sp. cmx-4-83 TaxID=2790940 RepID=UPI00397E8475